jgi:hypothetical protein
MMAQQKGGAIINISTAWAFEPSPMFPTSAVFRAGLAAFTKIFAIGEGLLPPDPKLSRAFKHVTLEVGLVIGGLLFLAGLTGSFVAVLRWRALAFGPITGNLLRLVIPSALAVALGFQIILTSFFLSVLGLRTRVREQITSATPSVG